MKLVVIPFFSSIKSQKSKVGEMVQKIRGLAAKPKELSLSLSSNGQRELLSQVVL